MNPFKTLFVVVVTLVLGAGWQAASGQTQLGAPANPGDPNNVYTVDYYSNANTAGAPDATVRIINPGTSGTATVAEDLCAQIYIFDANQEMSECCGCFISANGLLTLSVNNNLTSNPLLGAKLHTGVIKIVSTTVPNSGVCDPTGNSHPETLDPTLRAWATHIEKGLGTSYSILLGESQVAGLEGQKLGNSGGENVDLAEDCTVLLELGSNAGVCNCPKGH